MPRLDLFLPSWSRGARRIVAASAFVLSVCVGWAQNAVSTLASSATAPSGFSFTNPSGAAVDASGNVYVADALANVIRKITPVGVVTRYAGSSTGSAGFVNNADALQATFSSPQGLAIDGAGNLFVADTGNNAVRMIAVGTGGLAGAVTTVAGTGTAGYTNNGTNNTGVQFRGPLGITTDRTGTGNAAVNLFVADSQNHVIRKVVVATGATTTLAGPPSSSPGSGNTNGALAAALFALPNGIASNAAGTLFYVADTNNQLIRKIDLSATGNEVSTLAGSGSATYGEGTGTGAHFNFPRGVAIATSGDVLVADTLNHVIRSITTGGVTSRLAGTPNVGGSLADGLALTTARFNGPSGIATDATATYVVDVANQRVRKVSAVTAPVIGTGGSPTNQIVVAGATATFQVTNVSSNPPASFQWQRSTDSGVSWSNLSNGAITGGTISGATTATLQIAGATSVLSTNQFRVIVSNDGSVDNAGTDVVSTAATLTVNTPPVITNSGATFSATVGVGITNATITATGSPTPTFNAPTGNFPSGWATLNTTTGVITGAPSITDVGTYSFSVTATNAGGTSTAGNFTITVQSGPSIITHPQSIGVTAGNTASFSVSAGGSPAPSSYQWQVSTNSGLSWNSVLDGSIFGATFSGSSGAALTIFNTQATMNTYQFRVVVSNSVGSSTSNAAILTVGSVPVFTSVASLSIIAGQTTTHTVTATGTPTPTLAVVSGLPTWATFDPNTGVLSASPASGDASNTPYVIGFSATNSLGAPTQSFSLTVLPTGALPTFTTQPASQTVGAGQSAAFTVVVTGSPAPTIRWKRQAFNTSGFVDLTDDGTYSGTTSTTLTIGSVGASMSGDMFQAVATNLVGVTISDTVTLTLSLGSIFSTIAGQGGVAGSNDGVGSAARFNAPTSVGADGAGNTYVADSVNHVIRKITPSGTVTVFAGAINVAGSADGPATTARFRSPNGIAVDSNGYIYVADTFNHTIRLITPEGNVTTLAGSAGVLGSADGTTTDARFAYPYGIASDRFGGIYVADTYNHTIRKINGTTVMTLAGASGQAGSLDHVTGTSARFRFPTSLAVDFLFNIYVADSQNHTIRKVTSAGSTSTFAGTAGSIGSADGAGLTTARFRQPSGIAVEIQSSTPNVYVADSFNHTIRRITSSGDVTTLAGTAGSTGTTDGTGSAVRFNSPLGIAIDAAGTIYVADTQNHTVRRSGAGTAPTITTQPTNQNVAVGGSVTFTVAATGSPAPAYQWYRQAAGTSGFLPLSNSTNYSGVFSSTLTVTGATLEMNGDQFQAVVTNLVNPAPTTTTVTLNVVTPPVFTSANSATFRASQNNSFTVAVTSNPPATFSATGLPSGVTIDSSTGVISGNPSSTSGSPFAVVITANNGTGSSTAVTQNFTLTVEPGQAAPTITTHPASVIVNQGDSATFTVVATGLPEPTYQWRKDGAAINGATSATLVIPNAQASSAGAYTVVVTNAHGTVTSNSAGLNVNTRPTFVGQPTAQVAQAGGTVTFTANVTGGANTTYQWRRNGVAIGGATNATLTLTGLTANDAGNYDVVVTNSLGSVTSSLAQLTISTSAVAPSFTLHPANRAAVIGSSITLSAAASAAPSATYQWRRNGAPISGATNATLTLNNVQAGDGGNYDVVASNSAGTATSAVGSLRVMSRSFAGVYFGTGSGSSGSFAVYVRDDNTGVFLGYLSGPAVAQVSTSILVNDAGQFSLSQGGVSTNVTLAADGAVSGSFSGNVNATLSGTRSSATGTTQNVAGFFQAGAGNNAAVGYVIASASGQAFAVVQSGATSDGGTGSVNNAGQVAVATGRSSITGTITAATGVFTLSSSGAISAALSGASEQVLAAQRLANISSRARVVGSTSTAVAGFVISGNEAKPVLIRAVGPTLGAAPFNFPGALATPRLELHRVDGGSVLLSSNSGIGTTRAAIDAAGTAAGAFALNSSGADAALLVTLSPGNYTATVSSTGTGAGVALIEVYDLSAPAAGQKLFNISTRATAGTGTDALVAGVVVTGSVSKRVLIRGVGPGLAAFGLSGTLASPTLTLVNTQTQAQVAVNTGYTNSTDSAAIVATSASVGAFPLVTGDSAMVVSLPPGNYTAQVGNAAGSTGVAIIEVYELP